jgi:hypothetical protein
MSGPVVHRYDMTITHAEFLRLLPTALGRPGLAAAGPVVHIDDGDGRRIEVAIGPEESWQIGGLALPRTRVCLTLVGFPAADAVAFIAHFERRFQRGGG